MKKKNSSEVGIKGGAVQQKKIALSEGPHVTIYT